MQHSWCSWEFNLSVKFFMMKTSVVQLSHASLWTCPFLQQSKQLWKVNELLPTKNLDWDHLEIQIGCNAGVLLVSLKVRISVKLNCQTELSWTELKLPFKSEDICLRKEGKKKKKKQSNQIREIRYRKKAQIIFVLL